MGRGVARGVMDPTLNMRGFISVRGPRKALKGKAKVAENSGRASVANYPSRRGKKRKRDGNGGGGVKNNRGVRWLLISG